MRSKWSKTPASFTRRNCSSTEGGCRGTPWAPRPLQPSEIPSSIDERLGQAGRGPRLFLDAQLALQGGEMRAHPLHGERRIAFGERLDHLAVLADAAVREPRPLVREREQRRAADEMLHEAVELGVARELGQHLVEADRQSLAGL